MQRTQTETRNTLIFYDFPEMLSCKDLGFQEQKFKHETETPRPDLWAVQGQAKYDYFFDALLGPRGAFGPKMRQTN